jgi:hypothetical protein
MIYEFALVLDHEPTESELQAFVMAGLDNVGIEGSHGVTLAHFERDAATLAEAILTAVRQLEAAGVAPTAVASNDLVSLKDIASRTGRSYESVRLLAQGNRGPGGFPPPLSGSGWSLYSWAQVSHWFAEHYGTEAASTYDRAIAAADHLVRARRMLAGNENRAELAKLLSA